MTGEAFWQTGSVAGTTTQGSEIIVSDSGGFTVADTSVWGLTASGRSYYNPAGAAAGEAATYHAESRPYLTN